jgi:hypothetical protein
VGQDPLRGPGKDDRIRCPCREGHEGAEERAILGVVAGAGERREQLGGAVVAFKACGSLPGVDGEDLAQMLAGGDGAGEGAGFPAGHAAVFQSGGTCTDARALTTFDRHPQSLVAVQDRRRTLSSARTVDSFTKHLIQ